MARTLSPTFALDLSVRTRPLTVSCSGLYRPPIYPEETRPSREILAGLRLVPSLSWPGPSRRVGNPNRGAPKIRAAGGAQVGVRNCKPHTKKLSRLSSPSLPLLQPARVEAFRTRALMQASQHSCRKKSSSGTPASSPSLCCISSENSAANSWHSLSLFMYGPAQVSTEQFAPRLCLSRCACISSAFGSSGGFSFPRFLPRESSPSDGPAESPGGHC